MDTGDIEGPLPLGIQNVSFRGEGLINLSGIDLSNGNLVNPTKIVTRTEALLQGLDDGVNYGAEDTYLINQSYSTSLGDRSWIPVGPGVEGGSSTDDYFRVTAALGFGIVPQGVYPLAYVVSTGDLTVSGALALGSSGFDVRGNSIDNISVTPTSILDFATGALVPDPNSTLVPGWDQPPPTPPGGAIALPPIVEPPVALPPIVEPPIVQPPIVEPPVALPPIVEPPVIAPPIVAPPVVEPPVIEPPVVEPPVAEPPVALPPIVEPPVIEPPVVEPPVALPPIVEPPVVEPPIVEPPVALPPVVEPPVVEPPIVEPPVIEPPVVEPPVVEPPVVEPPVVEPPVVEPPVVEPPVENPPGVFPPAPPMGDEAVVPGDVPTNWDPSPFPIEIQLILPPDGLTWEIIDTTTLPDAIMVTDLLHAFVTESLTGLDLVTTGHLRGFGPIPDAALAFSHATSQNMPGGEFSGVPEPSSLLLAGAALAGLAVYARGRRLRG